MQLQAKQWMDECNVQTPILVTEQEDGSTVDRLIEDR